MGKKQPSRIDYWVLATAFIVWVWYDKTEPAQPPDEFQYVLPVFENCALFTEAMYDTTQSKLQFKINISPEHDKKAPYCPPYRLFSKEEAELQCLFEKPLHNDWRSPSSSHYGSPGWFIPQKDGGLSMRIDSRAVNRITSKDQYPLTHIAKCVQQLGG